MIRVNTPSGSVGNRALVPAVRVVLLCAFFLGLLSMHVLGGTAMDPMGRGGTKTTVATGFTADVVPQGHGDPHAPVALPHGEPGMGPGDCALLLACVLGFVAIAAKLARPGIRATAPRAGPAPYLKGRLPVRIGVVRPPSLQRLGICRR